MYAPDLAKKVLNQTRNTYDGAGRVILAESARDNLVVSSTRTVYNGDRTTVIPPPGGTVTTTVTDPMGRATTLLQYTAAPTLVSPANAFTGTFRVTGGTTTATSYGYDDRGNQAFLTDASGADWKNQYDLLGRVTSKTDPVAGTSSTTYDGVGNITEITDSREKTVSYVYDKINRRTGSFTAAKKDQSAANQVGKWEYDNTNNAVAGMTNPIGKLTTATTYRNGAAYTTQYGGFTAFGASTGETITIPATEGCSVTPTPSRTSTWPSPASRTATPGRLPAACQPRPSPIHTRARWRSPTGRAACWPPTQTSPTMTRGAGSPAEASTPAPARPPWPTSTTTTPAG
ncbi:hypothetical protein V2I01_26935 [Micromonospora sp. BRA006-A]|nr:hypothetical protein [Micromonospora sp. BRA006-A]